MRRTVCLLASLLVLPSLGSDSPKEYDASTTVDPLEGKWRLVEVEKIWGPNAPERENPNNRVDTFHGGTWTMDDGKGNPRSGTYRINVCPNPYHLDLERPNNWPVAKFIFQIDGDSLRVAGDPSGFFAFVRYPPDFNGDYLIIWTYKRVK